MARNVALFLDGSAVVGGIEADALGTHHELPFLTEGARLATARSAIAGGNHELAEEAAARGVVAPTDGDQILTRFVSPPDWDRFGAAVWGEASGMVHPVFTTSTMLVGGVAVPGCVGSPFENEAARRECAAWCLRNGLDEIAERVAKTPVGGEGPHCSWPDADLPELDEPDEPMAEQPMASEPPPVEKTCEPEPETSSIVVSLFGGVFPQQIG